MMVRISYTKLPDNIFVSNLIPLQTRLVYAFINADSLTYELRSIQNEKVELLSGGGGDSVQSIKNTIRKEMISLGALFGDEIRKKI